MTRTSVAALAGAGLVLALMTGCVADPAPSGSRPSTSAAPTGGSGSASGSTEPSEPAVPLPTTSSGAEVRCDNVLAPEDTARLEADGFEYRADRSEPFGPAADELAAEGALSCTWLGDGGLGVWFTILAEADAAWQARSARLQAAGWVETGYPVPGALEAPADYDAGFIPVIVHADGVTYFATSADYLTSLGRSG